MSKTYMVLQLAMAALLPTLSMGSSVLGIAAPGSRSHVMNLLRLGEELAARAYFQHPNQRLRCNHC